MKEEQHGALPVEIFICKKQSSKKQHGAQSSKIQHGAPPVEIFICKKQSCKPRLFFFSYAKNNQVRQNFFFHMQKIIK